MKTIVFAYHDTGCAGIRALLKHGFEIAAVFTHTDNPQENIWFESVAGLATMYNIPVYAPENVNHPIWVEMIKKIAPDMMFSFYYRNMLKSEILSIPSKGALNLHGSLLPAYRGRCPVNWVLVHGEAETGVTLHYMTKKPDGGDMVAQERIIISDDDTGRTLHKKSTEAVTVLLDKALPLLKQGKAPRTSQDNGKSSYFGGRGPKDGEIIWGKTATEVRNLIRAVASPYPGAFSFTGNRKVFIWNASVVPLSDQVQHGTVISTSPFVIACGKDAVKVLAGQSESGIYVTGEQLANELRLVEGMRFGQALQVGSGIEPEKTRSDPRRKRLYRRRTE